MTVLLDATVMELRATGIAKGTMLLYNKALQLDPSFRVTAVHRRPLTTTTPERMDVARPGRFFPHGIWRSKILPMAARNRKADILHFPWSGHVPPIPSGIAVATTLHDVLPLIIPNFFSTDTDAGAYRERIQRDIARTHLLMTDSEFSKKEIIANFHPAAEPLVVPFAPTVDPPTKNVPSVVKPTSPYFLYVGGYDPRKGLEPLLSVFTDLHRQKKITSRLILTGEQHYYSETLRSLINTGKSAGSVEERGYIPDDELASLLANARALVYPSKYEGFGLPPLEAMALGCPVITTNHTSLPEICGDAVCYIEPDDRLEFARALQRLEERDDLRSELSRKGKLQSAKFSWEVSARKFLAALQLTLSRKAGQANG